MITLTEAARIHVKKMMETNEEQDAMLRVGVTGGGCSGLSYAMHFVQKKEETDETFQMDDLTVLISKQDLPILKGTVIDYKENLLGGGFIIENPNAIASCGCGTSFRTKKETGTPTDC